MFFSATLGTKWGHPARQYWRTRFGWYFDPILDPLWWIVAVAGIALGIYGATQIKPGTEPIGLACLIMGFAMFMLGHFAVVAGFRQIRYLAWQLEVDEKKILVGFHSPRVWADQFLRYHGSQVVAIEREIAASGSYPYDEKTWRLDHARKVMKRKFEYLYRFLKRLRLIEDKGYGMYFERF